LPVRKVPDRKNISLPKLKLDENKLSLNQIIGALYEFAKEESRLLKEGSPSKQGYDFENRASRKIHDVVQGYAITKRPPRTELEYPSFSGIKHPFDNHFLYEDVLYPIECKSTTHQIEHLYAFNGKILDHALGLKIHDLSLRMRGIFLSTTELGQASRAYAFSFGIIPIDSVIPPLEYMIEKVHEDNDFREQLIELRDRVTAFVPDLIFSKEDRNGVRLEQEFSHSLRDWQARGYA
jgi:hypothetical protein